jgi:hypothetical protein
MRRRSILTVAAGVALLSALAQSAGAAARDEGPQCPAGGKGRLVSGGITTDGTPLYMRACGRASATFVVRGNTYRARGGWCGLSKGRGASGEFTWYLNVATGLVTNPPLQPIGTGLWLIIEAGPRVRPGRTNVIDSVIELRGQRLAAHGEAILRPRLRGGSFSLATHGDPQDSGLAVTGSWTCR